MVRSVLPLLVLVSGCDRFLDLEHVGDQSDASPDGPRVRPDGEPSNCPAGYTIRLETTASLYRLVQTKTTWDLAEKDCADDMPTGQTHLIVLSNRDEWTPLITIPPTYLPEDTWIGVSARKNGAADFKWVTAEDTAGFVVPAVLGAEPWEPDEPDQNAACGELRAATGTLHDSGCGASSNYICECDAHAEVTANF